MAEKPSPVDDLDEGIDENDAWTNQDVTPEGDADSEQSESDETSAQTVKADEPSEREMELIARVQQLEERIAQAGAESSEDEEEEDIEQIKFSPGDLPADYSDLNEAFESTGTYLARNTEKVRRELRKEINGLRQELRAVTAQSVRDAYKLDKSEEGKIAAFANEYGFQYNPSNPAQVKKVVELYRQVNAKPSTEEPAKKTARPTPRPRPSSTSARTTRPAERASRISTRRDAVMQESFQRAIRKARGG